MKKIVSVSLPKTIKEGFTIGATNSGLGNSAPSHIDTI